MQWSNKLTELLNISYPIVQAPMLSVSTPAMVAAISNKGGLGSLPVGGLSKEKTTALIRQTKALTTKLFAVNLFAHHVEPVDASSILAMQDFLEGLCKANNIDYKMPSPEAFQFASYKDQVEVLLAEDVPVVSFTFGILDDDVIKQLKERKIILIGTATCVKEALLLKQKGIDIIVAQGIEAGGHRGGFLANEPLPMIGLLTLISQMVNKVTTPILAAGGINDGKTIKAALLCGAKGVQVGSAFIASDESDAIPPYKMAVQQATETDTVLTRSLSGKWARGIRNKLMTEIETASIEVPAFPVQGALTGPIRLAAQQKRDKEFMALWAGQNCSTAEMKPAGEIFDGLINEAELVG